jgi:hypothetical protein
MQRKSFTLLCVLYLRNKVKLSDYQITFFSFKLFCLRKEKRQTNKKQQNEY